MNKIINIRTRTGIEQQVCYDQIMVGDSNAYHLVIELADLEAITGNVILRFVRSDDVTLETIVPAEDVIGNKIYHTLTEQETAVASPLMLYIRFSEDNLYTPTLIIFANVRILAGGDLTPTVEDQSIIDQIVAEEQARAAAEVDRISAEESRDTAEGLRVTAETDRNTAEGLRNTAEGLRSSAEVDRISAEESRDTAEGLRVTAEDIRATAEEGRVSAETLRQTNTATAIQACDDAVDRVNDSLLAVNPRYGLYWDGSLTNSATRLGDAVGMSFAPWVGSTPATNDFEAVRPWSDCVRCNLADDGTVNAFEGEPGFMLDGSNGQVMVRIPKYYYRVVGSGYAREWWVAPDPLPEFAVHPAFIVGGVEIDAIYVAAYMGSEETSKLVSKTGVRPQYNKTRSGFRALARARGADPDGSGWGICDFLSYSALQLLMLVMVGNLNAQDTIGRGFCDMPYSDSHTASLTETAVNRVVVTNAVAAAYQVNWQIGIGTTRGGHQVANQRMITAITDLGDGTSSIEFDGAAVDVTAGNIVYSMPQKTGWADALGSHTGRGSGTDGKDEICVLGVQGMWGNWWQFLDGANMDSSYYMWFADDPQTYVDDTFAAPYDRLESQLPTGGSGYLRSFSDDPDAPWSMMIKETGGDNVKPVGDYFYENTTPANRVLLVGGSWNNGSSAGPWFWYVYSASSYAYWIFGARLLYKPV